MSHAQECNQGKPYAFCESGGGVRESVERSRRRGILLRLRLPFATAALAMLLVAALPAKAHAASAYLGDTNGGTSITVTAGDDFQIVLWAVSAVKLAAYDCKIIVDGPAMPIGHAADGYWFVHNHVYFPGFDEGSEDPEDPQPNLTPPDHDTAMLSSPPYITGSGDIVVFTLHADEEGTVAIDVDPHDFFFADPDGKYFPLDLPSTLYVAVDDGEGDSRGNENDEEVELDEVTVTLSVESSEDSQEDGVYIKSPGTANYGSTLYTKQLTLNPETGYYRLSLSAPSTFCDEAETWHVFDRWTVDSQEQPQGQTDVELYVEENTTAEAGYTENVLSLTSSPISGIEINGTFPGETATTDTSISVPPGEAIVLTAPLTFYDESSHTWYSLHHWVVDSEQQGLGDLEVTVTVWGQLGVEAVYAPARFVPTDSDETTLDYATIQAAITAASAGDVVIVADGTYTGAGNRDIDFNGKALLLRSENGAANCTIDCEGTSSEHHRGFIFQKGETRNACVMGFTVTNGYAQQGAGVYITQAEGCASPSIRWNRLTNNTATQTGGAVGIFGDDEGSTPLVERNLIQGNVSLQEGGGLYIYHSGARLVYNVIDGNTAGDEFATYAQAGGGVFLTWCRSDLVFRCNEVQGNSAIATSQYPSKGGGIYFGLVNDPSLKLENNLVVNNEASVGAGIWIGGSCTLRNFTIAYNSASQYGGGIAAVDNQQLGAIEFSLSDSILWNNSAPTDCGPDLCLQDAWSSSECHLLYSAVWETPLGNPTVPAVFSIGQNWTLNQTELAYKARAASNPCGFVALPSVSGWDFHLQSLYGRWQGDVISGTWTCSAYRNQYDTGMSECLDAGDPQSSFEQEPFPNGLRVNQGAYGNSIFASWTPHHPVDGDVNEDCRVNILDLLFIRDRLTQDTCLQTVNGNHQADANQDGRINILDLIYVRNRLNAACP